MAETIGSDDESEFGSVTSSQRSYLKNCSFAGPESPPTKSSEDLDTTEILGNPISPSPAVTRTPILSLSTPMSLDSINDEDLFRTPPENASLSSAAESEQPRVRVSDMKLKSPSTTPVSASSPSLPPDNVTNSDEPVTEVTPLSSPPSFAAGDVRVPGKHSDLDSPSPGENLNLVSFSPSVTEGIKITETDNDEIDIPFKEVIEALLRNGGENLYERDDKVSYVDILKQFGLKFP